MRNRGRPTGPRVSIGIPAYNAAKTLTSTLETVLAQSYEDWEAIVVDDGSTDETLKVAEHYSALDSRIQSVRQPNGGVSRARNRAFEAMSPESELVCFLDADDLWLSDSLQSLVELQDRHPDAPAAHGVGSYIDAQGNRMPGGCECWCAEPRIRVNQALCPVPEDRTTLPVIAYRCPIISPGSVLIRKDAFSASGGWNPELGHGEDWQLWLKLATKADLAYTPEIVLLYRLSPGGAARNTKKMTLGVKQVRKEFEDSLAEDAAALRQARLAYRLHLQDRVGQNLRELKLGLTHGKPKKLLSAFRSLVANVGRRASVDAQLRQSWKP